MSWVDAALALTPIVGALWIGVVGPWLRRLAGLWRSDPPTTPPMGCYRTAAERYAAEADQRPKLEPFELVNCDTHCRKCRDCRFVPGSGLGPRVVGGLCTGSRWRRCGVRTEHFHVRCASCGARWLMATADAGGAS